MFNNLIYFNFNSCFYHKRFIFDRPFPFIFYPTLLELHIEVDNIIYFIIYLMVDSINLINCLLRLVILIIIFQLIDTQMK